MKDLISTIRDMENTSDIQFRKKSNAYKSLTRIYYKNVLIWLKKTMNDELTVNVSKASNPYSWTSHYGGTPAYSGDRLVTGCSVSCSGGFSCGGSQYVAGVSQTVFNCTSRIHKNTKSITVSTGRNWNNEGNNSYGVPSQYAYICEMDGTKVKDILLNGTTDLSEYNDGTHYIKIQVGTGAYTCWDSGSGSVWLKVSLNP